MEMHSGRCLGWLVGLLALLAASVEFVCIGGWTAFCGDLLFVGAALAPFAVLGLAAIAVRSSRAASWVVLAGVLVVLGLVPVWRYAPADRDGWNALSWSL